MKNFSYKKCSLATNEKFGRYVVAAENIKAGELLLSEYPFVCGPYWDTEVNCLNCYSSSNTVCRKCKLIPLCWNCAENHDATECEMIQKLSLPQQFLFDNFDVVTPLRFLLLLYQCAEQMKNGEVDENLCTAIEDVLSMESHCDKRKDTWIWKEHAKNVIKPLRDLTKIHNIFDMVNSQWTLTDQLLQKICGILDVNTFEVRTEHFEQYPIRGLFIQAALLPHDCIGNTFITVDNSKNLKVFASVDIKAGEIVYNNYTATLYGTEARQEHLTKGKYFECECRRCTDPTELGTHLSSLKCRSCPMGYMIQLKCKSNWKCMNCMAEMKNDQIQNILRDARQKIHRIDTDIDGLELFIENYAKILHPNHYLLIECKQKLAAIVRHVTASALTDRNGVSCFSDERIKNSATLVKLLKRKIELCKELIPVLEILQPGISRLKAIALYEQFVPTMQLAKLYHQQKSIDDKEYLKFLNEAETIARESIQMLLYEPISNPEGMLGRQAMHELKNLLAVKVKISKAIEKANKTK